MSLESSYSKVKVLGDLPSSLKVVICTPKANPCVKLECISFPCGDSYAKYGNLCAFQQNEITNNVVYQLTFTDVSTGKKWVALADQWDSSSSLEVTQSIPSPFEAERQTCSSHSNFSSPFTCLLIRKNCWKDGHIHFSGNKSDPKPSGDVIAAEIAAVSDERRLPSSPTFNNEVFEEDKQLPTMRREASQEENAEVVKKEYRGFLLELLHFLAPRARSKEEVTKWFYYQQLHERRALENRVMNFAELPAQSAAIDINVLDSMLQRWTKQEHKNDSCVDDTMQKSNSSYTPLSAQASVDYNLLEEGFSYIDLDRYDKDDIQLKRQVANRGVKALGAMEGTKDLVDKLCPYADFDVLLSSRGGIMAGLKGGKENSESSLSELHLGHSSLKESRKRLRAEDAVKEGFTPDNDEELRKTSLDSLSSVESYRAIYTSMDQCLIPWSHGDLSQFGNSLKRNLHDKERNEEKKEKLAFPILHSSEKMEKDSLVRPVLLTTKDCLRSLSTNQIHANQFVRACNEKGSQVRKYFFIPTPVISSSAQLHESVKDAQSLATQYLSYRRILLEHSEVTLKAAAWRDKYGSPCRCSASLNDELEAWWRKQEIPRIVLEHHLLAFHERLYHLERNVSEYVFMHSLLLNN